MKEESTTLTTTEETQREKAQFSRRLKPTSEGTALNSETAATMTTPINGHAQGYLPHAISPRLHSSFEMLAKVVGSLPHSFQILHDSLDLRI